MGLAKLFEGGVRAPVRRRLTGMLVVKLGIYLAYVVMCCGRVRVFLYL